MSVKHSGPNWEIFVRYQALNVDSSQAWEVVHVYSRQCMRTQTVWKEKAKEFAGSVLLVIWDMV